MIGLLTLEGATQTAGPPVKLVWPASVSSGTAVIAGYIFAPLLVAATTLLLHGVQNVMLDNGSDHCLRPYGIAYIIPILISGALGGWQCGAFTLLLSLLATDLFLLGRTTFHTHATTGETMELAFILLVSAAVLLAMELLTRNLRLLNQLAVVSEQRQTFFRDVLVNVTDGKLNLVDAASHLPSKLGNRGGSIQLDRDNIGAFRKMVAEAASEARLPQDRTDDLITAASECAMNAVVHAGGGVGTVTWAGGHKVQVWVADKGRGITLENLPSATLEKGFTTAGSMGFGMKMMLTSVDRIWLLTGPTGTTVVMEQQATAPPPAWLAKSHGDLTPAAG